MVDPNISSNQIIIVKKKNNNIRFYYNLLKFKNLLLNQVDIRHHLQVNK